MIPVGGLPALGDLQHAARAALPLIKAPTFVGHGALDGTVPVAQGARVARLLQRARGVESHVYSQTRHLMLLDTQRDELIADVLHFLRITLQGA